MDPLDLYLDECLRGEPEEAESFLARNPDLDTEARTLVRSMYRAAIERAVAGVPSEARGVPARVGDFRLLRPLGKGGMGQVFLAHQESLGREVAIKLIRPELQASDGAALRFRREAQAVARLNHPGIVAVHAMGEEQGIPYIAMEFVPGRNLDELLADVAGRGETLPLRRTLGWMAQVAHALAHAHAQGVIHRDVKPSNIRITGEDRALLLDFGLVREIGADGALTQTFVGSPLYAAPEQLSGAPLDERADIYGLGVTAYQCLTGRVPFTGRTFEEVLRRALLDDPAPPRRFDPSIPRDAEVVVLKALEREPDRRYPGAEEFAADLEAAREGRPVKARPPGLARRALRWARAHPRASLAAGLLLATALAASATFAWNAARRADERRAQARRDVEKAFGRIARFRALRASLAADDARLYEMRTEITARYFLPEEDRALDELEGRLRLARTEREAIFHDVLNLLREAESLDPGTPRIEEARAELYAERWREAKGEHDVIAEAFYREKVMETDRSGRVAAAVESPGPYLIDSDPPGAEIFLFRFRELAELFPAGERRLVPVAVPPAEGSPPPGEVVLRVAQEAGEIDPLDLVLAVAGRPVRGTVFVAEGSDGVRPLDVLLSVGGRAVADLHDARKAAAEGEERDFEFERQGARFAVRGRSLEAMGVRLLDARGLAERGNVRATLWRMGERVDCVLPPGLAVRVTAAPLFVHRGCRIGVTPFADVAPPGEYVLLLRAPGRTPVRSMFLGGEAGHSASFTVHVPEPGEVPPEFVYIQDNSGTCPPFAMLDREVTAAEYLEFLNDPATLARIEAGDEALVPRDFGGKPLWTRTESGTFTLPERMPPDWPALGVSWHDANDYALWLTARAKARREPFRFALPSYFEWQYAGGPLRNYPFGNHFRPKWVNSCYSREQAGVESVRSYPVDESPFGVFDMSGSVLEWLDDWVDAKRRRLVGGSWAQAAPPELFRLSGGFAQAPESAGWESGFRVIVRSAKP